MTLFKASRSREVIVDYCLLVFSRARIVWNVKYELRFGWPLRRIAARSWRLLQESLTDTQSFWTIGWHHDSKQKLSSNGMMQADDGLEA